MPDGRNHPKHQHSLGNVRKRAQQYIANLTPSGPITAEAPPESKRRQHKQNDEDSTFTQPPIPDPTTGLTFYPAYCHKVSPTWFEWVKLTAHDIHSILHLKEGYQHSWLTEHRYARDKPQLMFYLNHPVQFVQVVGIVVSFDEYFDRFWLFTIDDSSGSTIDIVCPKPLKEITDLSNIDAGSAFHKDESNKDQEKENIQLSDLVTTTVEIGAILQVKGVITLFRRARPLHALNLNHTGSPPGLPTRQLSLQRLTKLHDTNQELTLIAARTSFHNTTLSHPWHLTPYQQRRLHKEALGEVEHDKKRVRRTALRRQRLVEREREDMESIQREYDEEQGRREADAETARHAERDRTARLERTTEVVSRQGLVETIQPTPPSRPVKRRDHKKQTLKRGREDVVIIQDGPDTVQVDTTNDSFAALDDERSALLRLAFGSGTVALRV